MKPIPETCSLASTDFKFPHLQSLYRGKVRDVYRIGDQLIVITTDRISAFDQILPRAIPYKGQVLNQIAVHFLESTRHIVPNWLSCSPDVNVSVGKYCQPIPIEMVIRGYLAGHAYRVYKTGAREICGVRMPDGLREGDPFPMPIITPATKAEEGHDEDISEELILKKGLVTEDQWNLLKEYTYALFKSGTEEAHQRGLILVDTKYEFGFHNGKIHLIDEIHTPDSSRYYYLEGYEERQTAGEPQKQLSKEFVREWLIHHGFQGLENQLMPEMPDSFVWEISDRYIELFEKLTGQLFDLPPLGNILDRIQNNIFEELQF